MLALAFDTAGTRLASSGQDATIRLWSPAEPSAAPVVLESGPAPTSSLDFEVNGNTLASASAAGIRLWQVDDPDVPPVVIPGGFVYQAVFSPDGKLLASGGSASSYLRLWDLEPSGRPLVLDGKRLASGRKTDPGVRLWDPGAPDGASILLGRHDEGVTRVRFSPEDLAISKPNCMAPPRKPLLIKS